MPETSDSKNCCDRICPFVSRYDRVEICQTCGLGRTSLAGRAPELQDYVPRDADERAFKAKHLLLVFKRYLTRMEPGSLLDVGCADGILLDIAAAKGWRVLGLDSHTGNDRLDTVITGRFLAHEFSERFDALTFIHSLEHMPDPLATFQKCRSLVTQHGRLLIVVPNFGGWWSRVMGQNWQWLNVDDHRYHYTRKALAGLLKQAGFRIEVCRTYSAFAPSLPEMMLSARQVLDWPAFRWRTVRGTLYRLSRLAGVVCNPVADLAGQGAELQVLARPV